MSDRQTKVDRIVEGLEEEILSGRLPGGTWLKQEEIGDRYGVSATPVREALRRLQTAGLVEHAPYQGVRVVQYTDEDRREYFALRRMLETHALRRVATDPGAQTLLLLRLNLAQAAEALAAGNLRALSAHNWAFHRQLAVLAGSRLLLAALEQVWSGFPLDTLWAIPERGAVTLDEHRAVLAALEAGDVDAAVQVLLAHLHAAEAALQGAPASATREPHVAATG